MPEITSAPMILILWAALGYLMGSVPFGLVITRMLGLGDLRQIGSGNIGATNVLRTGNRPAATSAESDEMRDRIAVISHTAQAVRPSGQ